jgi:PAS domain S-box-containing protein
MENQPSISERTAYARPRLNYGIAWVILLASLLLTGIFTYKTVLTLKEKSLYNLGVEGNEIRARIEARLHAHAQLLRTGTAFFEASDSVTRYEWKIFIRNQKIDKNLPGVQGVGYSMLLNPDELINHEKQIRSEGFPNYFVKPAGKRSIYAPVIYIEPFAGRNIKALGYDVFSDPIRRKAMEEACDSNIAALSGKVLLIQESDTDIQAGTVMYVPVYQRGLPLSTVNERRKAIKGWVYSPYRMNDLMLGILGMHYTRLKNSIRLQIYDDDRIAPESLLYDSEDAITYNTDNLQTLRMSLPIVFNGRHWLIDFTQMETLSSYYLQTDVLMVFFGGTAISILIALLALSLLNKRSQLIITTQFATNLKENLDKHVALYNAIPDAVFISDSKTGQIEEINNKAIEQYGYTHKEFTQLNSTAVSLFPDQSDYPGYKGHLFYHDQFHIKKDGTIFPVEISISTFNPGNSPKIIAVARDISMRLKAETDLSIKNEVFENSVAAQSIADNNGFITHANQAFLRMWGFESLSQAIGRSVHSFFAENNVAAEAFESLITVDTWEGEFLAKHANGSTFIALGYATSIRNKQGEIIGFQSTNLDITLRKETELELEKSKERYQTLVENANDAIVVSLPDQIVYANKKFLEILGYSEEEVFSGSYMKYLHPDDQAAVVENYMHLIEGMALQSFPCRVITKDGKLRWVELSGIVIEWDKQSAVLSFITDITERKMAEEALLKSEEIFNQFMLNSPIYVFFKDENIRSLRLSRNFEEMLGRPLEELLDKTMDELFPSDIAKSMVADDLRVLNEGKLVEVEEELNGRYYSTTKFPIFVGGKPVYLAGYTIDITSRQLSDNMIKAALKEKEILLREVHHRVKNNLQVVSSLLNLQANKTNDISSKELLGQSRNRIRSIALVHEKLYQTGNFAEINIKEYTRSLVVELFRAYVTDPAKIYYRAEIENISIPLMYAIPCGLILNEIISNSLKHAFPENRSSETKPEIFISLNILSDKYMQLRVGDNGIGLPENYELTDSASLGLYLIHILSTEQLDGKIEISTKKGTIFTITFNPFQK